MANSFGQFFRISTFGESHGPAIGCIIDGCPAGLTLDLAFIQSELDRRRPGQSKIVSRRKESDQVEILSGVMDGISTGAPIGLLIRNEDARSRDYEHLAGVFRPSHADFTWQEKYGLRDHRGGGRSSARETANWVAAGAVAKLLLRRYHIDIQAFVSQVGRLALKKDYTQLDLSQIESNEVRCPDPALAQKMINLIKKVRKAGDTVGGIVSCVVKNLPAGLGEPVFDKLHADLGKAILSINACKGFEYGSGFSGAAMLGSEHNDLFIKNSQTAQIQTLTNHSGGVQGGISNGMDLYFRAAFKPVATLLRDQPGIDLSGNPAVVQGKGRHDPCVAPRAVPIVEAMTALVLADHLLRAMGDRIDVLDARFGK